MFTNLVALCRRYALSITLLLVAACMVLSTWTVLEAESAATQVAAERSASILRECNAQNDRHINTIEELDALLKVAEAKAPHWRRVQMMQSRAFTVLLIDALAPYQNCQHVLAKSTSTK